MRILYFYQYFGTSKGGWSTRVYEMTRRWAATGIKVTVITSMYDKSDLIPIKFITNLDIEGVKVKLVNIRLSNKHSFIKRVSSFIKFSITSIWYALTLKYDVIITSSGPLTIGLPGLFSKLIRRKTFIFEMRDLWPTGAIELGALKNKVVIKMAKWFEKTCYNLSDLIVTASPGQKEHVLQILKQPKEICVIPNASDNHLMKEIDLTLELPEWANGKKIILYAGTLGLIDDCTTVVRLAAEFRMQNRKDLVVVLIGDGKEKQDLIELASKLQLTNIHFLGLTSKENVMRWLSHSFVSLLTVKNVNFLDTASPNKIFDAFAAGIPVVQNTQGWIKEYIRKMKCGLTVPKSDPETMANAIISLADDPEKWKEMSKNSKRAGEEDFDRDALSSKMLEAILNTFNSHK